LSLFQYSLQQFGRFRRNARLYLISNALSGITLGIIQILYNLYLIALGYHTDFIGQILFIGTLGAGLAIFPAGICIDRFGGKSVLIWSSVLIGVAGAGQILFHTPLPLLISAFIVGVGGAFVLVLNIPFLALHSSPEERSELFSLNIVLSLITVVIGEAVGGVLPIWFRTLPWLMSPLPSWASWILVSQPLARSYQLSLLLAGVIAAPSFIPLFLLQDDRPQRQEHAAPLVSVRLSLQKSLARIAAWRRIPVPTLLFSPLSVMVYIQMLLGLGAGLLLPYFNVYFVQRLGASSALFGAIDAAANILNAVMTLLAPWLVLRLGKVVALIVPRVLSLPLMLFIGLTHSLPLAATLYPLRQGLMDMTQGILQVFSMDVVSQQHRGLANSSYQAAYQVMWAIGASVGGALIAWSGYVPVFICTTILYTLALVLLWGKWGKFEKGDLL
jgi:MFS family permease